MRFLNYLRHHLKCGKNTLHGLRDKKIITIIDFESSMTTRFEISKDAKYIKENAENSRICYEKDEIQHGQQTCRPRERDVIQEWEKIIAEMKPNKILVVYGTFMLMWKRLNKVIALLMKT